MAKPLKGKSKLTKLDPRHPQETKDFINKVGAPGLSASSIVRVATIAGLQLIKDLPFEDRRAIVEQLDEMAIRGMSPEGILQVLQNY